MTEAEHLRAELLKKYKPHLVCDESKDFVVEGYPRSANTFTVDMINVLNEGHDRFRLGHHTHDLSNVRLGLLMDKPTFILIRKPEDAILSFMIFSQQSAETAARRYKTFYDGVLSLGPSVVIVPFETVVANFNEIVQLINSKIARQIPLSTDLVGDAKKAKDRDFSRAEKQHGESAKFRVGSPTPEREAKKNELRSEVQMFLKDEPEIEAIYQSVRTKAPG